MRKALSPDDTAKYFFQSLMQNQCHVCWGLFSDKTQKEFIAWTLKDLYEQHSAAAKAAGLGPAEIKLMFETNNLDLIINFWRRFVRQSRATDFFRFGYFQTAGVNGKQAQVECRMAFPDGREQRIQLTMLNERGGWKLGYLESGLSF